MHDELLAILFKSWGVADGKLEIWGELPPLGDLTYGFLRNPVLIQTGEILYYPLHEHEDIPCRFFMSPTEALNSGSKVYSRFVRCELELSPYSERVKHNNPFSLCVKKGSAKNLRFLPKKIIFDSLINNDSAESQSQLISESVFDFYYEKALNEMEEDVQQRKIELEQQVSEKKNELNKSLEKSIESLKSTEVKRDEINKIVEALSSKYNELEIVINQLAQVEHDKKNNIQMLINKYEQTETEMNNKIKRLKNFVSEKATFLKMFEFVDDEVLDYFLLESSAQLKPVEGISFFEALENDYQKAVSYIQSYLVNNDILYPRHIVENYLTLLRTKDLIILAGDSGSGKTNLVKSFAKAVGGKSVIIPVKPNWTSSEDLLGYYNPLEKKYLPTPFLEAMLEAQQNPEIPYFICLDEMNLARVEYYFADFLSLLETRDENPSITLYADDESSHVLSELKSVVNIIESIKNKYNHNGVTDFIKLLQNEELNNQLRQSFGFSDKDSLIKYHSDIRRMLSAVMTMPASIRLPENIHIIGAINIDETTHYLSPKILDRAHIMRFESPLLTDWDAILNEVSEYEFNDVSKPLIFEMEALGHRANYPKFDRNHMFCKLFVELNKEFFHKLGIEFGMRTIRQGLNYLELFQDVNHDREMAINNFLLHKVLPKLTLDGSKKVGEQTKLELIERVFLERLKEILSNYESMSEVFSTVHTLENVVDNAKTNDGIVNFWS